SAALVRPLIEQAAEHAQRVGLEREQRAVLAGLGLPTAELPLFGDGVDLGALHDLAAELRKQGVGEGADT
ncbi:ATPase, partial [Streptomyces sp. SID8455]|nr:ATPase [Streptomyces sp. SID8455]